MAQLESLEWTVRILKDYEGKEKSVRFGHLGFSTVKDSAAWINLNPMAIKFSYFVDVYYLCLLVSRDLNGSSSVSDYYTKVQTVQKLDLGTTQEMKALEAFKPAIQSLFTEAGQGMCRKNNSAFSRFPKYSSWKSNVDKISYSISNVASGMNNQIDMNVHSSITVNPIQKLAVSLLTQSLQKYTPWLTKSYETFIEAGLSSERAWCLTTKLGECVLNSTRIQI